VLVVAALNLSLGGAFLELPAGDDVAVGDRLRVHLSAGAVDAVQDAKVVRRTDGPPRGMAVAWVDPRPRTFAVIEQMLRG